LKQRKVRTLDSQVGRGDASERRESGDERQYERKGENAPVSHIAVLSPPAVAALRPRTNHALHQARIGVPFGLQGDGSQRKWWKKEARKRRTLVKG
jgi:hypothetical protein